MSSFEQTPIVSTGQKKKKKKKKKGGGGGGEEEKKTIKKKWWGEEGVRKRGGCEIRGICCSEHVNANPFTLILVTPGTHETGGEKTRSTKPKRKKQ